jgi:hypothetical protein
MERASDIGVDEVLPAMSSDMRLVQCRRVKDYLDPGRQLCTNPRSVIDPVQVVNGDSSRSMLTTS